MQNLQHMPTVMQHISNMHNTQQHSTQQHIMQHTLHIQPVTDVWCPPSPPPYYRCS